MSLGTVVNVDGLPRLHYLLGEMISNETSLPVSWLNLVFQSLG